MLCPVCKEVELRISERQSVEIDYCPQCRGVWLDRGELDKLIERNQEYLGAQSGESAARYQESRPPDPRHPAPRAGTRSHRDYDDDDDDDYRRRRRKGGWLGELFDFD